jgi:hypothetical protein
VVRVHEIVVRYRETEFHDVVDVHLGGIEQFGNVLKTLLLLVFGLMPRFYCFSVPLQDNKVGIEEEDHFFLHFLFV